MIRDNCARSNFNQFASPYMRVLSDSQIQEIHFAALEVLSHTGMKIENARARDLLHSFGARVEGNVVKIPSKLVDKALSTVPSRVILCNREGERTVFLEGYNSHYGCNPDNPYYIDPYTGERRQPTSIDCANMARLVDYLPNIEFVLTSNFAYDVPEQVADRVNIRQLFFNMRKPIGFSCADNDSMLDIIDMAAIIAGGKEELKHNPRIFHIAEPISPLTHDDKALQCLFTCAENEIPIVYYPMTMAGVTAPATLAGLITQSHAESLTGMVLHQLTNPGAPFIYGAIPSVMDMSTTKWCYGAPEMWLSLAAMADMGHYFQVPIWGTAGTVDSKIVDQQCVAEMCYGYLMATLSGQNLVHDTGLMDGATVTCPEVMVLANELIGMVKKICGGFHITEDTLALKEINNALTHGNFLLEDHTYLNFRSIWRPEIHDRSIGNDLPEPILSKLNRKSKEIFETYQPPALDPEKKQAILELEKRWLR